MVRASRVPAPPASARTLRDDVLDARLTALSDLMDERLTVAALAVAVNTALRVPDVEPIDLADVLRVPAAVEPWRPSLDLHPTPAAALLQRAWARLERDGWRQGATVDEDGARCLYGALRAEAADAAERTTHSPSCWTPSAGTSPTRRPCPASTTPTVPAPSSACWTRPRTSRTPATSDHRRSTPMASTAPSAATSTPGWC